MLMDKIYYNPFKVTENITEAYYESAHKGGYYAKYLYASFTGKYINININKALAKAGNKTYIINGEKAKDQELIVNEYQKINSEIVKLTVPASAQLPHMEQPEEFLRQLFTIL